jgi:hypothetical protein
MIKDGKITTNGWLFIIFLVLVLTTPPRQAGQEVAGYRVVCENL